MIGCIEDQYGPGNQVKYRLNNEIEFAGSSGSVHTQEVKFLPVILLSIISLAASAVGGEPRFSASPPTTLGNPAWRARAVLSWFPDGNIGSLKRGEQTVIYAANGPKPVRLTFDQSRRLIAVEPVVIEGSPRHYQYLAGGPIYRDPASHRLLLFYHAEIHRGGSMKDFSSVLGVAIQTDRNGLSFRDAGVIFMPGEERKGAFDVGGAAVVVHGDDFYVYARDLSPGGKVNNLIVLKAPVREVFAAATRGKPAAWRKFYHGEFSEPALGGRSSPLEKGNPSVRWMDVSFNRTLGLYILVAAAPSGRGMALFAAWSRDGISWSKRTRLTDHRGGECFYPSIISSPQRECGSEFHLDYTYSRRGEWNRWNDAQWLRRTVRITNPTDDAAAPAER
ncbi:MAG: hypothetical protein BGO12_16220 [Verrucomicrobia bacterium 61-8]|nr:hypothetical protein [Verrucomicrobiota bacterium]OJU98789.1 MAG: hypothetical protein BGO12_16220 [Verrucomicrobia bacterium 61-8]